MNIGNVIIFTVAAFSPTLIAMYRNHSKAVIIFIINLIALVMLATFSGDFYYAMGIVGFGVACIMSVWSDDYV